MDLEQAMEHKGPLYIIHIERESDQKHLCPGTVRKSLDLRLYLAHANMFMALYVNAVNIKT